MSCTCWRASGRWSSTTHERAEPVRTQLAELDHGLLAGHELTDEPAGDRREREAEHAVTGRDDHVLARRRAADDRQAVRRARPKARPELEWPPPLEPRDARGGGALDGGHTAPVD